MKFCIRCTNSKHYEDYINQAWQKFKAIANANKKHDFILFKLEVSEKCVCGCDYHDPTKFCKCGSPICGYCGECIEENHPYDEKLGGYEEFGAMCPKKKKNKTNPNK